MFGVVANLLLHKQLAFEKGKISLFEQPIVIMPVEEFSFMQEFLEQNGLENLIYYSAKHTGVHWLKKMVPKYKMKETDLIEWGCNILTLSGWGDLSLVKRDASRQNIVFELKGGAMGMEKKGKTYSTDNLLRGYVAAFATFAYKVDMDAIETHCLSKGDSECKYVVKQKKDFDISDPRVKKQLKEIDLDKIKAIFQ